MKMNTLRALTLFLSLLFFGATNGNGTLEVIVQQIQEIGPGQWLRTHGGNRGLESACSVAERQLRLTFRPLLAARSARVIVHPSTIIPPE